jgi:beta-lactamase class A
MSEDRHDARIMIDAPALPPPAITAPAPREVSFGRVAGVAPRGTRQIIVRVGKNDVAQEPLQGRSFSLNVPMQTGVVEVRVTAVDGLGRRSTSIVEPVLALPLRSDPHVRASRLDPALARTVRGLVQRHGGTAGVYVQDLRTGRGAAWNARARFPAASTLKLAIAVTVMRSLEGKPAERTQLARLLGHMLILSDNQAANDLEVWLAGSTSGGSAKVNETMRALGLNDSLMYGGYVTRGAASAAAPIPIRVESQPAFGLGKYTTAWDLARLARAVYLAAAGKGPLLHLGVSASEARYLLWLLAQVADRGKLDRYLGPGPVVMHKAGWLAGIRHDNGIVTFHGGVFVATVMTWQTGAADDLAGRVALAALTRFAG